MEGFARYIRGTRIVNVVVMLFAIVTLMPFDAAPVVAISPDVVISQIYGGGGNSGAPYKNDFVELYNRSTSPVTMANWSVQYQSAGGATWTPAAINGTINGKQYFLIQLGGGANGAALPTPDASPGAPNLSATAGKVALVTTPAALTCSTNATCFPNADIKDLVGYGALTTAVYEGSGPAPAPSNTSSDLRKSNGEIDTDNNNADFIALGPCPRNTTLPAGSCVAPIAARIHDIQGAAHTSPLKGKSVASVPGIVTALRSNGFYMEDPSPDSDDATSEGIFVFTSAAPTVAIGDSVTVDGTVTEFRPGGASTANLTTTEISTANAGVSTLTHGNPLPAPIVVGAGGRVAPATTIEDDATGDVETSGVFDPANDALDFYESLEGMRVQVNDAVAVGPTNQFGETPVLPDNGRGVPNRSARGGVYATPSDFNPRRVILAGAITPTPKLNVRDMLPGTTVGVLDYNFGNFMLEVTSVPAAVSGGLTRETTATETANQLAIATFNVENLDPGDGAAKFNGLANIIINNLRSPDIVALEEMQDNNGATDDGTVDATATANMLISAIQAVGGPTYQYRDINPVNDQDGGEPGGNIRVAFLYRTDRGLAFVERPGGTSTAADTIVTDAGGPHLAFSPGRIDPTKSAFTTSRKPLAGEFTFHGQRLFVIANHFNSKGGDTPLFGHIQPPSFPSQTQRTQQATIVHDFVQSILDADAQAKVVVLGDINDFQFSTAVATLKGTILTDLITTLPDNEQYTYDFEGNSEVLDHILVTGSLNQPSLHYDVVHVNSEFTDQVSDHEPQVVRFTFAPSVTGVSPDSGKVGAGTTVTITGGGFLPGATVMFGDRAARDVRVVNDTTITAEAPPQPPGIVDVKVTNPDGQSETLPGGYTYETGSGTVPPGRTTPGSSPGSGAGRAGAPVPAPPSRP